MRIDPNTTIWFDEYAQNDKHVVFSPLEDQAGESIRDYEEARTFPVGNGRLAAMIYGKTDEEWIRINESTVWSGGPHNYANELKMPLTKETIDPALAEILTDGEMLTSLPEIYRKASQLVLEKKIQTATALLDRYFMGDEIFQTAYQPFVTMKLRFGHEFEKTEKYYRSLDICNAVAVVEYNYEKIHIKRETFASYPDQILVTRVEAAGEDSHGISTLSFSASFESEHPHKTVRKILKNHRNEDVECLSLVGKVRSTGGFLINRLPDVIHFEAMLWIETDGKVAYNGKELVVKDASTATVYVSGGSNYLDYLHVAGYETDKNGNVCVESMNEKEAEKVPHDRCHTVFQHLQGKTYTQIKKKHIEDYQKLFGRSTLVLGKENIQDKKADAYKFLPTDERIAHYYGNDDLSLENLYFNYGKYLLISSSRSVRALQEEYGKNSLPTGQPANLQGIWNWNPAPSWGAKLTANINVQMNYFMSQTLNLEETEWPLFDAIKELAFSGRRTARAHYGITDEDAWVLHHNFDLWRGTAPVDMACTGMWPTGGAWLAHHLWEHYIFHQDRKFLEETAYPIMKGAAAFFEEYLQEYWDPVSKKTMLVSPASISPEHGLIQMAPTMDTALIRNLLTQCVKAAEKLDIDEDRRKKWSCMAELLPAYDHAENGNFLREWFLDGLDEEIGDEEHRHLSQLWGLYPGMDVTPFSKDKRQKEIFEWFVSALKRRGEGTTGWSTAWRMCLCARTGDGNGAYSHFTSLIKKATAPNLWDLHPKWEKDGVDIFQIDGNLGATAGIVEMLIQSSEKDITILPALPEKWDCGKVKGLCTRCGYKVDIVWKDNRAEKVTVYTGKPGILTLRFPTEVHSMKVMEANGDFIQCEYLEASGELRFQVSENRIYLIYQKIN